MIPEAIPEDRQWAPPSPRVGKDVEAPSSSRRRDIRVPEGIIGDDDFERIWTPENMEDVAINTMQSVHASAPTAAPALADALDLGDDHEHIWTEETMDDVVSRATLASRARPSPVAPL